MLLPERVLAINSQSSDKTLFNLRLKPHGSEVFYLVKISFIISLQETIGQDWNHFYAN